MEMDASTESPNVLAQMVAFGRNLYSPLGASLLLTMMAQIRPTIGTPRCVRLRLLYAPHPRPFLPSFKTSDNKISAIDFRILLLSSYFSPSNYEMEREVGTVHLISLLLGSWLGYHCGG